MKKITYGIATVLLTCMASSAHAGVLVGGGIGVGGDNGGGAGVGVGVGNDPAQNSTNNNSSNTESALANVPATNVPGSSVNVPTANNGAANSSAMNTTNAQSNTSGTTSNKPATASKTNVTPKDHATTKKVVNRYQDYDYLVPLEVTTRNGVVAVAGEVNNDLEFEQGYLLAATTEDVRDVNFRNLAVNSSDHFDEMDRETNARAKAHLYESGLIESDNLAEWNIDTSTENGVIYVNGRVANDEEREAITQALYEVEGVNRVLAHRDLF